MKRLINKICLLIMAFTLFIPFNVFAAPSATSSLVGNSSVEVGNQITISWQIGDVKEVDGGVASIYGVLEYDTEYLELVSSDRANCPYDVTLNKANNKMAGIDFSTMNAFTATTKVQNFIFKAKKIGNTTVKVSAIKLSDAKPVVIPINGGGTGSEVISKSLNITDKVTPPPVVKSNDATLKSLSASGYTLSPSFNANTLSYNVEVPDTATIVDLVGQVNHAKASATGLGKVTLTGTETTAKITVTAEDETKKVYTVIIKKIKKADPVQLSSDATLKSLDVSGYTLTPTFKPDRKSFSMRVRNNIDSLNVDAVPNDSKAKVEISGNKNWKDGMNTITIKVTAEDGTTNIYTVNVNKETANGQVVKETEKASDNYLTDLKILSSHEMSPKFNKDITSYNVKVPYEVNKLDISYIASDKNAKVKVLNNDNFKVGEVSNVEIEVTAEDGSTRTYVLNVTRDTNESNTSLEKLIVKGEDLLPQFTPEQLNYILDVGSGVKKLDITAVAKDKDAKVEIIGNDNLKAGKNHIFIKVTDKNGYSKFYQLEVNKEEFKILGLAPWQLGLFIGFPLFLFFLLLILLKKRDKDEDYDEDNNKVSQTGPVIEFKPEFNFGSKNNSDDDNVYGGTLNQDSTNQLRDSDTREIREIPYTEADYEEEEEVEEVYDPFDATITKQELIDAIREAQETKDASKLKMLLDQDELNQRKKKIKARDEARKRAERNRVRNDD